MKPNKILIYYIEWSLAIAAYKPLFQVNIKTNFNYISIIISSNNTTNNNRFYYLCRIVPTHIVYVIGIELVRLLQSLTYKLH